MNSFNNTKQYNNTNNKKNWKKKSWKNNSFFSNTLQNLDTKTVCLLFFLFAVTLQQQQQQNIKLTLVSIANNCWTKKDK